MENLLAGRVNTKDGHGGKANAHRAEMEEIAKVVFRIEYEKLLNDIEQMIYAAQYNAYEQALKDVVGILQYDIESVTQIGFEGCKDIFKDKKA